MMRFGIGALAAAVMLCSAVAAVACDKEKTGKTASLAAVTCDKDKSAGTATGHSGCSKGAETAATSDIDAALTRVMSTMPQITYKVGDVETKCSHTAKSKAQAANLPVQYLVGDESFTCRQQAMDKQAELIRARLQDLAKVTAVVDGETINCSKTAAGLAAEKHVPVKYVLAGVEFDCPNHADSVAAKLAAKMTELESAAGIAKSGCAAKTAAGCSKSDCCAKTAAAGSSGCAKAATASASGCGKSDGQAEAASTKSDCHGKSGETAEVAGAKSSGCDKADKDAATAAAKSGCCAKTQEAAQANEPSADGMDETPALANAKKLVRDIVEFVAAAHAS